MHQALIYLAEGVVVFLGSYYLGVRTGPSLTAAIKVIDTAEQNAVSTLKTIGAHKATTAAS